MLIVIPLLVVCCKITVQTPGVLVVTLQLEALSGMREFARIPKKLEATW
jgi:hypothetical protein